MRVITTEPHSETVGIDGVGVKTEYRPSWGRGDLHSVGGLIKDDGIINRQPSLIGLGVAICHGVFDRAVEPEAEGPPVRGMGCRQSARTENAPLPRL